MLDQENYISAYELYVKGWNMITESDATISLRDLAITRFVASEDTDADKTLYKYFEEFYCLR